MTTLKLLIVLSLLSISIFAQKTQQQIEEEQKRLDKERQKKLEAQDGKKMGELDPSIFQPKKVNVIPTPTANYPTKEQAKLLLPATEDLVKYSAFLSQRNTGIFRIFPELECGDKYVVRVDGDCLQNIPLSSFYSFRKKKYSEKKLSDIGLKNGVFYTDGLSANGFMVALGDVPIESVKINSIGMQLLVEFPPAVEENKILANSTQLKNGIKVGDYWYSETATATENTTYAIRVIAYRGKNTPRFYIFAANPYDSFILDKRADIIVIFRIVRKEEDGNLTLLWKELQRKDSPKIKTINFDKWNNQRP